MAYQFGRLPLPRHWSRPAFPSRCSLKLLKHLSTIIERLYSFSVRCQLTAVTHYTKAITLVIFPVFHKNCCVKLLDNFIRGLSFIITYPFLEARLLATCFPPVSFFFVCLFLAFSLKLWIKNLLLSPHLSATLFSCLFATYLSINLIPTFWVTLNKSTCLNFCICIIRSEIKGVISKSQVWLHTKIAGRKVHLPLHNIHFV